MNPEIAERSLEQAIEFALLQHSPTPASTMPRPCMRNLASLRVNLETQNSRIKDFHDLWALSCAFELDGAALQQAVAACFDRRHTPWTDEAPQTLTPAFYQMQELATRWRNNLAAGVVLIPPPAQFANVGERIIELLDPVRQNILAGESLAARWSPAGPWAASALAQEKPA